jgi:chitodextrinase
LEYKKSSANNWSTWNPAPNVSATSATVTGLTADTDYNFRLTAQNTNGSASSAVNVTTKSATINTPSAPANFYSTTVAQTTISLDWNNVDGATEYILQRKSGNGVFETIVTVTESKFIDSGLTANTQYEYRVQASGAGGHSAYAVLSEKTTAKTDHNGTVIVDTPMFVTEPAYNSAENNITIEWTNLGDEYTYVLYKTGRVVANFSSDNSYIDANPSVSGVEGYALLAFHKITQQLSNVTMSVVHTTAKPLEITGHDSLPDGKFRLLWTAEQGVSYNIFRAGRNLSGQLTFDNNIGFWQDDNPLSNNDYMLVAVYQDGQTYRTTFSNIYNLKKTTQSQSAVVLDAFWADYDLNLVDDDVLNAIA